MFFDDQERSETYTEQITQCPDCGQRLERRGLQEIRSADKEERK